MGQISKSIVVRKGQDMFLGESPNGFRVLAFRNPDTNKLEALECDSTETLKAIAEFLAQELPLDGYIG